MGSTELHHHAVGPHVAGMGPGAGVGGAAMDDSAVLTPPALPPLQGVGDDIGTQPGAQVAGMFHIGVTVLHHHAVGSKVVGMPLPPSKGNPNWAESDVAVAESSPLPRVGHRRSTT